ncbi:nuclear transport factor 2 family protein [Spirosoma fluminis]
MNAQRIIHAVAGLALAVFSQSITQAQVQLASRTTNQSTTNSVNAKSMENQAAQTVKTFLTAVQKGDQATFGGLVHPNIRWSQPGTNRFSGVKKSSADVFKMVGGMFEATANTLRLTDIKQLTVNGNNVACLIRWEAAQPGGGILNVDNIDVYTVENGKIVETTVYSADLAQEDQFWGK